MATVSNFEPAAIVGKDGFGHNILGLNKTHDSETTAVITGTGFASQDAVNVTWGTISWSGNLIPESESTVRGSVALTCNNPPGPDRLGETVSVSVTVGGGISAAATFPVNVGAP